MNEKILELYDLIKRNDPRDWDAINRLHSEVEMDEDTTQIIYETVGRSCHLENAYADWT